MDWKLAEKGPGASGRFIFEAFGKVRAERLLWAKERIAEKAV